MPRISDPTAQAEIQDLWNGVRTMYVRPQTYTVPFLGAGGAASYTYPSAPSEFYNLPFVLAFSALDSALGELCKQGAFVCTSWMLGKRMEASRTALPWQDYPLVEQGKNKRNLLAHQGLLLGREDCLLYIRAIEVELTAWGVVQQA